MGGLFLWGLYDYRRAPRKLTKEQRQKLKSIAKAWDVTPEELQNRVVPKAIMAVSGVIALALMAVQLLWAVVVLVRGREAEKQRFHRFSVVVWAIWLIPYLTGAVGSSIG